MLYYKLECTDWDMLYDIDSSEVALAYLYEVTNEAIDDCTPRKRPDILTSTNRSRFNYPDWFTADLIRDIERKWRYHKLFKKSGSKSDYAIFSKYRSMVKEKLTATFDAYQERLQSNFMNDPKSFWSFIRRKQSKRDKTRVTKDGVELKDEECAECFASYFHSVYSPSRPRLDPREAERAASRGADSARVHVGQLTPSDLRVALRTLKPKHSVGPDGIPPYIIKDCRVVLEKPLLHVFNRCLKECHYPDRWKTTRVIPVPKGGGGADVSGYRPIAVLSAFAKVFESVLHKCIYSQCCVVSYSRARAPLRHLYEVAGEVLPRVTRVRDLGLEM
ncbi:putative RNA-directed DNA polymerase from transposon BS, partial [Operophtera brumata]